jgi:hypothetical protein
MKNCRKRLNKQTNKSKGLQLREMNGKELTMRKRFSQRRRKKLQPLKYHNKNRRIYQRRPRR